MAQIRTRRSNGRTDATGTPNAAFFSGLASAVAFAAGLVVHEPADGAVHFARWRPFDQDAVPALRSQHKRARRVRQLGEVAAKTIVPSCAGGEQLPEAAEQPPPQASMPLGLGSRCCGTRMFRFYGNVAPLRQTWAKTAAILNSEVGADQGNRKARAEAISPNLSMKWKRNTGRHR
jgi:hypothetical protein